MSQEYHELTEKIHTTKFTKFHTDAVVRSWLREAAQKLQDKCFENRDLLNRAAVQLTIKEAREILGLESAEFRTNGTDQPVTYSGEPQDKKMWCEHLLYAEKVSINLELAAVKVLKQDWKFCPICAAPRPAERTLHEELAEKIYCGVGTFETSPDTSKEFYLELASRAITFLKSKGISL